MTSSRIISGDHMGADRGGLDAALLLSIPCGRWWPLPVKACADLVSSDWVNVGTVALVGGINTLTDADCSNHESRVYRVWPYQGP